MSAGTINLPMFAQPDIRIAFEDAIKAESKRLGFALCGITSADSPPHHEDYRQWIEYGNNGEMEYLARQEPKRGDLESVLPGAKSVVAVAFNYATEGANDALRPSPPPEAGGARSGAYNYFPVPPEAGATRNDSYSHAPPASGGGEGLKAGEGVQWQWKGTVARYARFDDYHEAMWARLSQLLDFIKRESPLASGKAYCDTGPITERDLAMRAGIGWIGKHTNLISRKLGNWFFLGELILDIPLVADAPETPHCGSCTRCIPACPTQAITAPYQLDARRCISYLTIELKGSIPVELRPLIGNRIYGCDDCLAACPWNRFAVVSDDPAVQPRADLTSPDLVSLLSLTEDGFRRMFANSPIKRTKRRGLLRNVCVALGNIGDSTAVHPLTFTRDNDPEPLVREHAAWAIERILSRAG